MDREWRFDNDRTKEFTRVRQSVIGELLATLRPQLPLSTALDVGCGVGHFSQFLAELNFRVVGVDGRKENIEEAIRRNPGLSFLVGNAEEINSRELGTFDFVLCVGLIYHLENPLRALRNLAALTDRVLFLESLTVPGEDPELKLLDEEPGEDQGLHYVAFYPTESCLIKLLYRSGFPFVYGFRVLPQSSVLLDDVSKRRERVMLVASKGQLSLPALELLIEPRFSFGLALLRHAKRSSFVSRAVALLRGGE